MVTIVTVLGCKTVSGKASRGFAVGPLESALLERWSCDAMLQCGHAPDGRRITKRSPPPITMTAVAFDFDPPHHEPDALWSAGVEAKLRELVAEHGGYAYSTRAGWRWVATLAAPTQIHTAADWAQWRARYAAACDWLAARGLATDRSCSEPGRLFRLPCVVRDGQRLEPITIGDVQALGAFELPEAPSLDALHPPSIQAVRSTPDAQLGSAVDVGCDAPELETSPLYRRLRDTGALGELLASGAYAIRCPHGAEHSGSDGLDGSTLFFPPGGPGSYGHVHCHHAGCAGLDLDALVLGGGETSATAWHVVQIAAVGVERTSSECRVVLQLAQPAPCRYVRVSNASKARWRALWIGADVAPPEDLAEDLSAACRELQGARLVLECEGSTVRRILPAREAA